MAGEALSRAGAERTRRLRRLPGVARAGRALDPVVHERVRLGVLSALAVASPMSFVELKDALVLSDGNLSVHARRLEEAGYIACTKRFEGRSPRTEFAITVEGSEALGQYLEHMESIIRATRHTN